MSQEFGGALPSVILAELDRLPAGFMEEIVEMRRMSEASRAYHSADSAAARQAIACPLVDLAEIVDFELAQEAIDQAKESNG